MTTPKCPKCERTTFEIGAVQIHNARYPHNAIVCASCGCVVGVEENLSITYMLGKIAEKLGVRFGS